MKIDARELARDFVSFCDGCEEGGLVDYARRGRVVADELRRALDALDAERSHRVSVQDERDRWRELFMARASAADPLDDEPSLE